MEGGWAFRPAQVSRTSVRSMLQCVRTRRGRATVVRPPRHALPIGDGTPIPISGSACASKPHADDGRVALAAPAAPERMTREPFADVLATVLLIARGRRDPYDVGPGMP